MTTANSAVGTPAAAITSFANAFEPSSRAAAADGPKHATPVAAHASARPSTSGASGPTTTRSTPCTAAKVATSSASTILASRAMPALPGVHNTSGRWAERASARTMACSRPPAPTTRTRFTGRR